MMKDTFKNVLSFEFWQKFGKALMVVIAVMPAAGLMISIGKSIVMINPTFAPLVITGGVLEQNRLGELSLTFISCSPSLLEEAGLRNVLVVLSPLVLPSS